MYYCPSNFQILRVDQSDMLEGLQAGKGVFEVSRDYTSRGASCLEQRVQSALCPAQQSQTRARVRKRRKESL